MRPEKNEAQNYQHVLTYRSTRPLRLCAGPGERAARGKLAVPCPPHRSQILAIATTSSGGAYPFTLLSGSSFCISAVQLGTKEAGICQQDAPTV